MSQWEDKSVKDDCRMDESIRIRILLSTNVIQTFRGNETSFEKDEGLIDGIDLGQTAFVNNSGLCAAICQKNITVWS